MFHPRVIAVLLLSDNVLVKTTRFQYPVYIGDPINAVRIFNDFEIDELIILDIGATKNKTTFPFSLLEKIVLHAKMPLGIGGGFNTIEDITHALQLGAEKIILGTSAIQNESLIKHAVSTVGASAISICIDVKKGEGGDYYAYYLNGSQPAIIRPDTLARKMQSLGVGEIILQNIDNDGTMEGFDLNLLQSVSATLSIPVVALGGAGNISHLKQAFNIGKASAIAAGSMFVFYNNQKQVLINYPRNTLDIF